MPRKSDIKRRIIDLALQGKTPQEIAVQLASEGTPRKPGYITKVISVARSEGFPIPIFNTAPDKENAKANVLASRGGLSTPRMEDRRLAAVKCLQGFRIEEIIEAGYCKRIDVKEIIDVCELVEPFVGNDQYLCELRGRGMIGWETATYRDAAIQIEDRFWKKDQECIALKEQHLEDTERIVRLKEESEGKGEDLARQIEETNKLARGRDNWHGKCMEMEDALALNNKLTAKYGAARLRVLLERVNNLEETKDEMEANRTAAAESLRMLDQTNEKVKIEWESFQTRMRVTLQTHGISRESEEYTKSVVDIVYRSPIHHVEKLWNIGPNGRKEILTYMPLELFKDFLDEVLYVSRDRRMSSERALLEELNWQTLRELEQGMSRWRW